MRQKPIAAEPGIGRLALLQDRGVQADRDVVQKHPPVQRAHRDEMVRPGQDRTGGGLGVDGHPQAAGKVVERAQGQHSQRGPGSRQGMGHAGDGAVAPGSHDDGEPVGDGAPGRIRRVAGERTQDRAVAKDRHGLFDRAGIAACGPRAGVRQHADVGSGHLAPGVGAAP